MSMMEHFNNGMRVTSTFDPKKAATFTVSREIVEVVESPNVHICGTPTSKVYPAIPFFNYQILKGWKIAFRLSGAVTRVNIKYDPDIGLRDLADATFFRVVRSPAPSTEEIVAVISHMRKVRHMEISAMIRVSGKDEHWVKVYKGLTRLHPKLLSAIDLPEDDHDKVTLTLGYKLSGVPNHTDQWTMWERLKSIQSSNLREYAATLMKEKMGFRKSYTPTGHLEIPRLDQLPLRL